MSKTAYVFPGQGSQFVGMGKDLYEQHSKAKEMFDTANTILGFDITDIMFNGTEEDLKATKVTQPAVFLHSVIKATLLGDQFIPSAVAGHSLGEFSALVASGGLSFESGLELVKIRANAMQEACEKIPGTMAAIVGLDDAVTEQICNEIDDVVIPANYNCPGQLVISGSVSGVEEACKRLTAAGAKRAIILQVGGAFHSPLMAPAKEKLEDAICKAEFRIPICPIYQNVDAKPHTDPEEIKENLIKQLTGSVKWTQIMQALITDGHTNFIEVGGVGGVLSAFIKRMDRSLQTSSVN